MKNKKTKELIVSSSFVIILWLSSIIRWTHESIADDLKGVSLLFFALAVIVRFTVVKKQENKGSKFLSNDLLIFIVNRIFYPVILIFTGIVFWIGEEVNNVYRIRILAWVLIAIGILNMCNYFERKNSNERTK